MDNVVMFMFRLLHKINGIVQNHIMAAELEIAVTACLGTITQEAVADLADSVPMEHLTQHASLLIHMCLLQHVHHININAKAMT